MRNFNRLFATSIFCLANIGAAYAQGFQSGDLLASGGSSSTLSGPSGGILTPWASIGGNATGGHIGATGTLALLETGDYRLQSASLTLAYSGIAELSVNQQQLSSDLISDATRMNSIGLKIKILSSDDIKTPLLSPSIALGVEHKRRTGEGMAVSTLQGQRNSGTDLYLALSEQALDDALKLNLTLRLTNANQAGFLGFGSSQSTGRRLVPEFSAAYTIRRDLSIGAEYRFKPNRLAHTAPLGLNLHESDWQSVYIAWTPHQKVTLRLAYVELGTINPGITPRSQHGYYLSFHGAY